MRFWYSGVGGEEGIRCCCRIRRTPKEDAMSTATQVADWIVRFSHDDLAAPVTPMSLEKITYYAQCFWLALEGDPLFKEPIRAWRHGPVIRAVWDAYRDHGAQPIIPTPDGDQKIDANVEQFLCDLVTFLGGYTAIQLSNATHAEEPWLKARQGYGRRDNSDILMPVDELRSYYCSLISEGEEALSAQELWDVVPHPRWAHIYVAGISSRKVFHHPFYSPALAKTLAAPIPSLPELEADFYAPIGKPDFIEFKSATS